MTGTMFKSLLSVALLASSANAQLVHFNASESVWLSSTPALSDGNVVTLTPDESLVVVTSNDGTITAITPSGNFAWSHTPQNNQVIGLSRLSCTSGVTFATSSQLGNYMVYAVTDGFLQVDPSACRVIALDYGGTVLWESIPLEGACSGTPVVAENGEHVFLTHNLVRSGKFTVLFAHLMGQVMFFSTDLSQPFSPPGIFFNPAQGYYDGGQTNRNDILLWSYRPFIDENGTDISGTFAFQFPETFDGTNSSFAVRPLRSGTNWQSISPPTIYNSGYSAVWSVSRNQVRVWNGVAGNRPTQFDRRASHFLGFVPRCPPTPAQPIFATPAISSDPVFPSIFTGTCINRFVALDSTLSELWTRDTTTTIQASPIVSPDDEVVYFVEANGFLHAVNASTGVEIWGSFPSNRPIRSNFALSRDGFFIYIGDLSGNIVKLQVATGPTSMPSSTPSSSPTAVASGMPSAAPVAPSTSPTAVTSMGPSAFPTFLTPSDVPTSGPTPVASVSPSSNPSSNPSTTPSAGPTGAVTAAPTPPPTPAPTPGPTPGSNTPAPQALQEVTSSPTTPSGASVAGFVLSFTALMVATVML